MSWADIHLGSTLEGRYLLRGELISIPSSSSSSSSEAQRMDVSRLRSVLNSRRDEDAQPLASMTFPEAYGYSWRSVA
eukprot:CAMPEP_0197699222 /NCGR_PEP_ID=MMETSP1338-20131121/120331_1 /TAXON_ID=43686 ORGANISM="Pelagodinium beii, Strain RCC1491" /NCGR_SAMPLE_ID=MMETSP1338 /ASSEMBLY_ACC=CAM_ASM_000754 /LENGTH=76 /DNA_ID=CAMNT_0043282685 /DNA_START=89 /DNA_END=319 /DNA_ORIENTATION=-